MRTLKKFEIFKSVFSTRTHGCSGECSCGKWHYAISGNWDIEYLEKELPEVQKRAKETPELYQFHDLCVQRVEFNGNYYVVDCSCKYIETLFEFLQEDRDKVINYLNFTKDKEIR